jgi:hypothetical protein
MVVLAAAGTSAQIADSAGWLVGPTACGGAVGLHPQGGSPPGVGLVPLWAGAG